MALLTCKLIVLTALIITGFTKVIAFKRVLLQLIGRTRGSDDILIVEYDGIDDKETVVDDFSDDKTNDDVFEHDVVGDEIEEEYDGGEDDKSGDCNESDFIGVND